jgi:hypothetical protein
MTLSTEEFRGASKGMFLAGPYSSAPEGYAKFLVDLLVDRHPEIRQRGPIRPVTSFPSNTAIAESNLIATCLDPMGRRRYLFIDRASPNSTITITDDTTILATHLNTAMTSTFGSSSNMWDAKPSVVGGLWLSNGSFLGEWSGGVTYMQGAGGAAARVTAYTATTGQVTLAGVAGLTDACVGCYINLHALEIPLGMINKFVSVNEVYVDPKTQLSTGNLAAATAAFTIEPVRDWIQRVGQGTISCNTSSTVVVGSGADFKRHMEGNEAAWVFGSGAWYIFRARDGAFIGKVQNDGSLPRPTANQLRLTANAAVACDNEEWYGYYTGTMPDLSQWDAWTPLDLSTSGRYIDPRNIGMFTAIHGQRQVFGRGLSVDRPELRSSIWVSERGRPWCIDQAQNIKIGGPDDPAEDIINLAGTENGTVIWKSNATYLFTGDDPDEYAVQQLLNDGIVGVGAYAYYNSGVVWCGFKGVHIFDGTSFRTLTAANLGAEWTRWMRAVTYARVRCMVVKNMLWISLPDNLSTGEEPIGDTTVTCVAIDLNTEALTLHSGPRFWAGSADIGAGEVYYLSQDNGVCYGTYLQDKVGRDTYGSGQRPYLEANTLQAGGAAHKLWFRQANVRYFTARNGGYTDSTDVVRVRTAGNTDTSLADDAERLAGSSTATTFPNDLSWFGSVGGAAERTRRIRFSRRARDLGLVIYTPLGHQTHDDFRILGWSVSMKPMRERRQ